MNENIKIFKALSDNNRLRILKALQARELCVCEIKELLALANSTVSQHLKLLKETGFVKENKTGKWVNYHINPKPDDNRIPVLLSELDFWINNPELLKADAQIISELDRKLLCSSR